MEYWSIEKIISGCEVFHKPSLYNISIRDQIVLPPLQHSITPILHKPFKFQETKSPLGITKAGSFGPGFLHPQKSPSTRLKNLYIVLIVGYGTSLLIYH